MWHTRGSTTAALYSLPSYYFQLQAHFRARFGLSLAPFAHDGEYSELLFFPESKRQSRDAL